MLSSTKESLLFKGGRETITNITKFMKTLVIYNRQEFTPHEDAFAYRGYGVYIKSVNKSSSFGDHNFTKSMMLHSGVDQNIISSYDGNPTTLDILVEGNTSLNVFLNTLRSITIDEYIDGNSYVSTLCGKPNPRASWKVPPILNRDHENLKNYTVTSIDVLNNGKDVTVFDITRAKYPETSELLYGPTKHIVDIVPDIYSGEYDIEIHNVRFGMYPKTYTALYSDGLIDLIISENPDAEYLKYMTNNITPELVRESEQFDILSFGNDILTDVETDNFLCAYNRAKTTLLTTKYSGELESYYENYSHFELVVVLFSAFQKFCVSYIDKYAIRDYSDREVYDILESVGLGELRDISISILRKLVRNIANFLAYRGTEKILQMVLDIIAEDMNLSVKRFDIIKTFPINAEGVSTLDPSKSYDEVVGLSFIDKTIYSTSNSSGSDGQVIDYDDFVSDDPTWAGAGAYMTEAGKQHARAKVKDSILRMSFNRLPTKYIGLTNVLYLNKSFNRFYNKLALLLQYDSSLLTSTTVMYDGIEVTPFDLYNIATVALKSLQNRTSPIINPVAIDDSIYIIPDMFKLNVDTVGQTIDNLMDTIIRVPSCVNKGEYEDIHIGTILTNSVHTRMIPYIVTTDDQGNVTKSTNLGELATRFLTDPSYLMDYNITNGTSFNIHIPTIEESIANARIEIAHYINSFSDKMTSFDSIISAYPRKYEVYERLVNKRRESMGFHDYHCWKYIYGYFNTDVDFEELYSGYDSLFETFDHLGSEALIKLNNRLMNPNVPDQELEVYIHETVDMFRKSLSKILDEPDAGNDFQSILKESEDLTTLIDTFVSVYVELRDVNITIDLNDAPYNTLVMYDKMSLTKKSNYDDKLMFGERYHNSTTIKEDNGLLFGERITQQITTTYRDGLIFGERFSIQHNTEASEILRFREILNHMEDFDEEDGLIFRETLKIIDTTKR